MKQSTSGRSGTTPARARARTVESSIGVEVLHVDGAAAPELALVDLAAERVQLPVARRRRVRRRGARGTSDGSPWSPPQRASTLVRPGLGLPQLALDADLVEQRRDVLGGLALARTRLVAEVGGVDPDQVTADLA